LKYGGHLKFFKIQQAKGRPTPLDFQPETDGVVQWVLNAYQFLSPLRIEQIGMGGVIRGFIPVSEVIAYASAFPVMLPIDEFTNIIRKIDVMHIKHLSDVKE